MQHTSNDLGRYQVLSSTGARDSTFNLIDDDDDEKTMEGIWRYLGSVSM